MTHYAQIKNGKVQNIIVLEDPNLKSLFGKGFDALVEITQEPGHCQIGWNHDSKTNRFFPDPSKETES